MEENNTKAIRRVLKKILMSFYVGGDGYHYSRLTESDYRMIEAALAEPQRNCDVGTAAEQTTRYRKFCSAHKYLGSDFSSMCKGFGKGRCPFFNSHTKIQCEFAWAQMPYEEGGAR